MDDGCVFRRLSEGGDPRDVGLHDHDHVRLLEEGTRLETPVQGVVRGEVHIDVAVLHHGDGAGLGQVDQVKDGFRIDARRAGDDQGGLRACEEIGGPSGFFRIRLGRGASESGFRPLQRQGLLLFRQDLPRRIK